MASRKENIKSLFSNTRTRVIIIFTMILLVVAVVVGYMKLRSAGGGVESSSISVSATEIQSIPGAMDQTAEYVKLQEAQNRSQAEVALKSNESAIPTIIQTQKLGEGVGVIGASGGKSGPGFTALALEDEAGAQRSLWIEELQNGSCSKTIITKVLSQGAQINDLKKGCSCIQLKDNGYSLKDLETVCECKELKAAGYNARDLKDLGYTAGRLRNCGFDACELRGAGFSAQEMKDGGYSDGELKGAGFSDEEIERASGLPDNISAADVLKAGCGVEALTKLRQAGVSASAIRKISGCSADQLKAAGYTAKELKDAGFSAADLKKAGFTAQALKDAGYDAKSLLDAGYGKEQLLAAGFTPQQVENAGVNPATIIADGDCSVESLKKARAAGVSALTIKQTLGCSAKALKDAGYSAKELKAAGFTAAELKNAGFNAKELKAAGFSPKELYNAGFTAQELKDAGFSAKDLKAAGFSAQDLKDAGFGVKELKDAGFSAADLKAAGFTPAQLKDAGFSAKDLKDAGFNANDLKNAGFSNGDLAAAGFTPEASVVAGLENPNIQQQTKNIGNIPGLSGESTQAQQIASNNQQLQAILDKQNQEMAEQKYQQKIQQRTSDMLSAANQSIQNWKKIDLQTYVAGSEEEKKEAGGAVTVEQGVVVNSQQILPGGAKPSRAIIKTGDIVFAVMDTSVNSDEPGPILATIVSGKLKGTKLIGSFNLPSNSDKMVITFNTMSVPGAAKTISISAYAIDPNTARTALSSRTNHHYLMRYGSMFAASFMQGFGNAFQSANTTVTIGGTGGGNNITVQNGIGRSTLQNAVIGLATVGKAWGQQAQQLFNTPTTVEVYSGTGLGILFTQDVTSI